MRIESVSKDGLHRLEFDDVLHKYWLDGQPVPGATAVGSAYPKGEGLIKWMIKQGIEEYESKTKLKKAGEIGTVLHAFAEAYEKGQEFDYAKVEQHEYRDEIERVIGAFKVYKSQNQDKILLAEEIIASPDLRAAGKFDILSERGDKLVLKDYKTGKSIYVSALLQVGGGYRRMLREWLGVQPQMIEIVKFPKDAKGELEVLTADNEGFTVNGKRVLVPNLFQHLEDQYARNLGTWRFQHAVEGALSGYYDELWAGRKRKKSA
jgi:hypothetical protein